MQMSKKEFIEDVWDNLMKNTHFNPTDFSKIEEDCLLDCDSNEIHIGNFVLTVKENEDEFIDFDKMNNSQKIAFLTERNGYIEDGIGLDDTGNEFRDDNGQALFIDEQENEDAS